jgi:F0F1-type ATP synthase assembly protein I
MKELVHNDAKYYRLAGRIFADFSGVIAIPAVLAVLLGKWLDQKQGTEPRYIVIFLVIAFFLTGVLVVKKAKFYKEEYESLINGK